MTSESGDNAREMHPAAQHATARIDDATILTDPFPHFIIDDIFPEIFYEEILSHLPPISSLSIPAKFGMMKIGDDDPTYRSIPEASQKFWSTFDNDVKAPICAALLRRYLPYAEEKLSLIFGDSVSEFTHFEPRDFRPLRGIVQCRTTGARMGAHVDKATSLFTYLFYFAHDDSLRPFGTIFYDAPDRENLLALYRANRGIRAWFPTKSDLEMLNLKPRPPTEFRRNRLVSYANLPYSLHGAATDAAAARYSMQSFCDLPATITQKLYEGWKDPVSPTGVYRGDS
jgi:hypothetical protein